jgi:hypothetical protein
MVTALYEDRGDGSIKINPESGLTDEVENGLYVKRIRYLN